MKKVFWRLFTLFAKRYQKYTAKKYLRTGRWYARYLRCVLAECGEGLQVNGHPNIFEPSKIHMGKNVTINSGCQIAPRGEVYIGDYVTMSRGSQIVAGGLDMNCWMDERYKEHIHTQAPVYIGEGTWLCINSIVLPGVSITGKGVVVAAGAVVTHDITEDYCIVGGVPARIVRRLSDKERVEKNVICKR